MPQLKTFQLKDFRRITSQIPDADEKIHPMLAYLLLTRSGRLIKVGVEMSADMKVDFLLPQGNLFKTVPEDIMEEDLLILEQKFSAIVDKTKSESITIEVQKAKREGDPDKVVIHDERNYLEFQKMDYNKFPEVPTCPDLVGKPLDSLIISAMKIAKSFIDDSASAAYMKAVHINKNYVAGVNTYCIYTKEFEGKSFPEIHVSSKQVDMLSQFETLVYYDGDNRNFFSLPNKDLVYSFKKEEFSTPHFEMIVDNAKNQMKNGAKRFIIEKEEVVEFLELIDKASRTSIKPTSFMNTEEDGPIMYLNNNAYNEGIKRKIAIAGEITPFTFSASMVMKSFKALPQHQFTCYIAGNNLIIHEQDNSIACFFGVQQLNEEVK